MELFRYVKRKKEKSNLFLYTTIRRKKDKIPLFLEEKFFLTKQSNLFLQNLLFVDFFYTLFLHLSAPPKKFQFTLKL